MENLRAYLTSLQSSLNEDGPGFSSIVVQHGQLAFELHHGLASIELGVPLSGRSAYYMASESKQFTAACIFALIRDGRIGLDDDVTAHLPELSRFEQAFSLRSLLNHTSGIPDYFQFLQCQAGWQDADYFNNARILKIIERIDTAVFPSGTEYRYSNSNYILLAALIERLSGTPCSQFAKQRLFDPLHIGQMGFDDDRFSILPHRVCSYETDAARPFGVRQDLGNANTVGDGGLYASTDALLVWERHWHRQWASPDSIVHAMLAPSPLPDGCVPAYRFGLELGQRHGEQIVFHGGQLWGFHTLIIRIPALAMSIVQLANTDRADPDLDKLVAAALN